MFVADSNLSVVILTANEEIHIQRCLQSAAKVAHSIFVVDCFSTDKTVSLSESFGAMVFQNKWEGLYSRQFNWALDNLPIKTEWVLRLDADEYLTPELIAEINQKLKSLPADITGVILPLRRVFLGRTIRRGMPKIKLLRLFRHHKARCEQRLMDEHMQVLEGRTVEFKGEFADHNLNDFGWWIAKHNGYAIREAADLLNMEYGILKSDAEHCQAEHIGTQASTKRVLKSRYAKMPLFLRSFLYFCLRYGVHGGFTEGTEGFLWHFMQGWWYRTLVDVRIWEITKESAGDPEKMLELLRTRYGLKI